MRYEIDRTSGLPIYLQLKEIIHKNIKEGIWQNGYKLPTERELANKLKISRNTVSTAYNELEKKGLLYSLQGKGTFVKISNKNKFRTNDNEVLDSIDNSIDIALKKGYSLEEYLNITHIRVKEKQQILSGFSICFIECNIEEIDYFTREIELGSGITIIPILLDDLIENPKVFRDRIQHSNIILTTFSHIREVEMLLNDLNCKDKELLGISVEPKVETLVKIARITKNKKIGLVCNTKDFATKVIESIKNSGIEIENIKVFNKKNINSLLSFINGIDIVIASPNKKKTLEDLNINKEVIEFIYKPDLGSIAMLKSKIYQLREL